MKMMYKTFGLSNEEFNMLMDKFKNLTFHQSWDLLRRNIHNNHTDDFEDIKQELFISVIKAGVYYKRQIYIETSLELCKKYVNDPFIEEIIQELDELWSKRTKHGANKQRFGERQEKILDSIMKQIVPPDKHPDPKRDLVVDKKFAKYCKQITWNQQRSLGRKITKERSLRNGLASLSAFPTLDNCEKVNW